MSIFSNLLNKSTYDVVSKVGLTADEQNAVKTATINTVEGENGPFKVIDFQMKNGAVLSGVLGSKSPVTADGPVSLPKIFLVKLRKVGDDKIIERWQVDE